MIHAIVNSLTPACRNPPEKSPFLNGLLFFKKPSVLSELERSAEETTIFSIFSENKANIAPEAERVA